MSFMPFDIALAITQLQAKATLLRQVKGAADYASIKSLRDFVPPCAYVLMAREKGQPNPGVTVGQQHVTVSFGVVIAVRNYRASERGAQVKDELGSVLAQVRAALMGWVPPLPGARPTQFIQGDAVDYDQSTLLWTEMYQTQHSLQP